MAKITKEIADEAKAYAAKLRENADNIIQKARSLEDAKYALTKAEMASLSINVAAIMQHLAEEEG